MIRAIVKDYVSYIDYDAEGNPRQLYLRKWLPSKVIVDVRRCFGQPIFAGSGVRVADEFGLDIGDVRTAARILLGRAA